MSEYNYTAASDDDEHSERYGVQALTVEYDPLTGRTVEGTEAEVDTELTADEVAELAALDASQAAARPAATLGAVRVKVICSCGYYTCGMVGRFGHPEPVYQGEIKPLPSQYARDKRADELHGRV